MTTSRVTLIADANVVAARAAAVPAGLTVRAVSPADAEALAHFYLGAYVPVPGASTLAESREEMRAAFAGDCGQLWLEASPVACDADGTVVAAVMTVVEAPADWNAPAGPYVIEVATASAWRGRGLASALLAQAALAIVAGGASTVALRVDPDNGGAFRLYAGMGFRGVGAEDAQALRLAVGAPAEQAVSPVSPSPSP